MFFYSFLQNQNSHPFTNKLKFCVEAIPVEHEPIKESNITSFSFVDFAIKYSNISTLLIKVPLLFSSYSRIKIDNPYLAHHLTFFCHLKHTIFLRNFAHTSRTDHQQSNYSSPILGGFFNLKYLDNVSAKYGDVCQHPKI